MERREALSKIALLLGIALVDVEALLARRSTTASANTPYQNLLEAIADVILPDSPDSPGAKKAGVGPFLEVLVNHCFSPGEQASFAEGIRQIGVASQREHRREFVALSASDQRKVLLGIDQIARQHERNKVEGQPEHPFTVVKRASAAAYFCSEVGVTQALRYNPIPGRFDGCVPYTKGEKAWS